METWLSEDVPNNEILLPDYKVHRLNCNRHGGGIALYVHNSLSCKVLLQGGPHNLEFLALSVTCRSASVFNKFCICLFYHPPSSPGFIFDNLCTTLQMVNPAKFSTFILLGDFNVNFCNPQHLLFSHVSDILYNFSLVQVVPSFTHVSPNGSTSLIDLALLSDISCLQSCTTLPPLSSSDHLGVSHGIKWKAPSRTTRCKPQRIWNYRDADFLKACELIRLWSHIYTQRQWAGPWWRHIAGGVWVIKYKVTLYSWTLCITTYTMEKSKIQLDRLWSQSLMHLSCKKSWNHCTL